MKKTIKICLQSCFNKHSYYPSMNPPDFQTADLEFLEKNVYSKQYDDVYFSKAGALEESRYVFLEKNNLPERFSKADIFTICELGFGCGVNFLQTYKLWKKTAEKNARLFYFSCEKNPLKKDDLKNFLTNFSEIKEESDELLEKYPPMIKNWYPIPFYGGRVTLVLMFEDALQAFSNFSGKADVLYLDGFSPSKNKKMWSHELFSVLAAKSKKGTTFSTYTSAGFVKENLLKNNFSVNKTRGFAEKKEMLSGFYEPDQNEYLTQNLIRRNNTPWYNLPYSLRKKLKEKKAIIIGAGFAGASVARALAERGFKITIFEKEEKPAMKSSANPVGLTKPVMNIGETVMSKISLSGFHYTKYLINDLQLNDTADFSGILQLAVDEKYENRFRQIQKTSLYDEEFAYWVNSNEASKIAGVPLKNEGLYLPYVGRADMPALTAKFLEHENISFSGNQKIKEIRKETSSNWRILNESNEVIGESEIVILASGAKIRNFAQTSWLPVSPVRGQTGEFKANEKTKALKKPFVLYGFISPEKNGFHISGATYSRKNLSPQSNEEDYEELFQMASGNLPGIEKEKDIRGWTGFRPACSDFIPIAGALPDIENFKNLYHDLDKGKPGENYQPAEHLEGLYVTSGHGSHGMVYCAIAAEVIAAQILGEPMLLSKKYIDAMNPARFLIRDLVKHPEKRNIFKD